MTKGFKSTLLTVAVALLGFNAMATAPTIGNVPDIIIGDLENGSASNIFVYQDAVNLDTLVSDDTLTAGQIIWSYSTAGTAKYNINGKSPNTGDLVAPGAARIDNSNSDTYTPQDANPRTITFRNVLRTPGPGNANGTGVPDNTSDSQVLTLIASDASTASTKSFMVYSDNDSADATSGSAQATELLNLNFQGSTNGWISRTSFADGRGSISFAGGAQGLCITVTAGGIQLGVWQSEDTYAGTPATAYDSVVVTANSVYELRTQIAMTGTTAGTQPAVQVSFENTENWYGATLLLLDFANGPGVYGANASTPGPLSTYVNYYAPAAYRTAEFQAALSNPANATLKNMRLSLGVIDSDGGPSGPDAYGGGSDAGTMCFRNFVFNRYDGDALTVVSTPYDQGTLVQAVDTAAGVANTQPGAFNINNFGRVPANTSISFAGGDLTISPANAAAWQPPATADGLADAFVQAAMGDKTLTVTAAGSPDMTDNFPIPWVSNRLYRMTYYMYAPDANGQNSPPDFFYVAGVTLTNELINTSFMTTKFGNSGMPNTKANAGGQSQPYSVFFYTNNQTLEAGTWRGIGSNLQVGAVREFLDNGGAGGSNQNIGGIAIDRVVVEEVTF